MVSTGSISVMGRRAWVALGAGTGAEDGEHGRRSGPGPEQRTISAAAGADVVPGESGRRPDDEVLGAAPSWTAGTEAEGNGHAGATAAMDAASGGGELGGGRRGGGELGGGGWAAAW